MPSVKLNGGRLWPDYAVCHWPDLHTNFHEKISEDDRVMFPSHSGLWKCSWCERMLTKFVVVSQSEDGKIFEGFDRETSRRWKLRGTESWGRDSWKSVDEVNPSGRFSL